MSRCVIPLAAIFVLQGQIPRPPGNNEPPLSKVLVLGLSTLEGARILMHNASGDKCQDSILVPAEGEEVPEKRSIFKRRSDNRPFRVNLPAPGTSGFKRECWCETGPDPKGGIGVLAPNRAMHYQRNFGNRLCSQPSPLEFTIFMRTPRQIEVQVWTPEDDLAQKAKDDIVNADWILGESHSGILLNPTFQTIRDQELRSKLPACFPAEDTVACCKQVETSDLLNLEAINVFYGSGGGNFSCSVLPFVSAVFIQDVPILGDSAHEIAHLLGLNAADQSSRFPRGHTTITVGESNPNPFLWDNVMWEGTHYLKHRLTPGQVFWINQSNSGFLSKFFSSYLPCDTRPAKCPPFDLGVETDPSVREKTVQLSQIHAAVGRRLEAPAKGCNPPATTYKDGRTLENDLSARFEKLKEHVKARPALTLGSDSRSEFLRRWEPQFALNLKAGAAAIPSGLRRDPKLRAALEKVQKGEQVTVCPADVTVAQ